MIHVSWLSRSACAFRYSSWGTSPPPARNWMASSGYNGSRVSSARRLASVDFPPPAFPNTATLFMGHAPSTCPSPRDARGGRRRLLRRFQGLQIGGEDLALGSRAPRHRGDGDHPEGDGG